MLHRGVPTYLYFPPPSVRWECHPTYSLLGFSAALAPKFKPILKLARIARIICIWVLRGGTRGGQRCRRGAPRGDGHRYPKLHVSFGYLGGAMTAPGELGTSLAGPGWGWLGLAGAGWAWLWLAGLAGLAGGLLGPGPGRHGELLP